MPRRSRLHHWAEPAEDYAAYFKERIYATFTGLAIVLVAAEHDSAAGALLSLALGVVGITAAGFVADVVSIIATRQVLPTRKEWITLVRIAGGALSTAVVPALMLLLAAIGVMSDAAALTTARNIYVITLAVIGWLVIRRSRLPRLQQLFVLLGLVALGVLVIGVQTLAHGAGGEL